MLLMMKLVRPLTNYRLAKGGRIDRVIAFEGSGHGQENASRASVTFTTDASLLIQNKLFTSFGRLCVSTRCVHMTP